MFQHSGTIGKCFFCVWYASFLFLVNFHSEFHYIYIFFKLTNILFSLRHWWIWGESIWTPCRTRWVESGCARKPVWSHMRQTGWPSQSAHLVGRSGRSSDQRHGTHSGGRHSADSGRCQEDGHRQLHLCRWKHSWSREDIALFLCCWFVFKRLVLIKNLLNF